MRSCMTIQRAIWGHTSAGGRRSETETGMNARTRLVIVGADAAGMSAASEAPRLDKSLQIVAFDCAGAAPYSQCGLPYLVGSVVADSTPLVARTVE
jgi:hypothetical protein